MNDDKPLIPSSQPELPTARDGTQWVMVFNLHLRSGKEEIKKTFKVNKKRIVVGSALSSDIRIQQNSVSNVHAVIEMDEKGHAEIFDMASETGLFVNDKKVVSQQLKDGDEIKIGFATLTFKRVAVGEASSGAGKDVRTTGSGRKLFYDAKEDFRPLILEDERNVIQIFDYPAAGELCLQVVEYWGSTILEVDHVVDGSAVTVGEGKKASFLVPGLHADHELVNFEGPSAVVQLTDEMKGVVRTGNRMVPLHELESRRLVLKKDDLAKIQLKEVTLFLSYTPLPPHLRRQRVIERDPLYTRIFFTTLITTGALLALIMGITPTKPLEPEQLPPPVVVQIFKPIPPPPPVVVKPPKPPEPKVEEPKPKVEPPKPKVEPPKPKIKTKPTLVKPTVAPTKVPPKKVEPPKPVEVKTVPHPEPPKPAAPTKAPQTAKPMGGSEGQGAKAAGPEGQKGRANAPKAALHQNDSQGNPNTKTATKSQVQGPGNVEAMFSDLGGSIAKSMAAGSAGAHAHGENLKGFGSQTTEGNGGLGQIGTGGGGGGDSTNSQGLGKSGRGEGLHGSGLGAIGSGGNLSGSGHGYARPSIEVGSAGDTVVMGGLDKSVIDEYIKRHMPQIRACYEKELNSAGKLSGRIATRFDISGSGRVAQAGVTTSSMNNSKVEGCLIGVLKNIVFPEPLGGGTVSVDYPFNFTPAVGQ